MSAADCEPKNQHPFGAGVHEDASERAYIEAVLDGHFHRAEELFALLPNRLRVLRQEPQIADEAVFVHHRADWIDRFLGRVAGEGLKGAWALKVEGVFVVFAYDEWLAHNPQIGDKVRNTVAALRLATRQTPRKHRTSEEPR